MDLASHGAENFVLLSRQFLLMVCCRKGRDDHCLAEEPDCLRLLVTARKLLIQPVA